MIIKKLNITQFKNHLYKDFEFSEKINCFVGNNGMGKTNVLDALHYLSVGKSFLGSSDVQNIYFRQQEEEGMAFFSIRAEILGEETEDALTISYQKEAKKIIRKNDKPYERLADHIGYLPSVMISPYDSNLISDSGESRRKFMDAMISQTDSEYLHQIMGYQKALQQRNALLKYFYKNRIFDKDSLEIYDEPLANNGNNIFQKRKKFIAELSPIVQQFYTILSGGNEVINVSYISNLEEDDKVTTMQEVLYQNLEKDKILTYTGKGVHKDDLLFAMNGLPIKKTGSQGQQKSFLIALKLAQIARIKSLTGKNPIVLLDDIFDKLDDSRVANLIDLLSKENFGQIFITDTHLERTSEIVHKIDAKAQIFHLS
ncbi:DNA replication/repair protein RecF [Bergeyella zoohelcum]|uniref:DNA replication and repair protein RecF n=1 Tax=Bergeyella zoohelcum ATCC 43767 TaxID=883096 RepID=K1M2N7_9FLAO|nr:DNA replication/repair protein RecF [Bergeyella zoohelcum]EKB56628.1 DNA replication and repair protein RecF [Bergeyella zoohelcum ATCC 43767]SUV48464.1 DNA replication and repair protein recF [Bergeyella zoohelcum]